MQQFQNYSKPLFTSHITDQFGGQKNQQLFSRAPNLNTAEIKQIVDGLNRPPFM